MFASSSNMFKNLATVKKQEDIDPETEEFDVIVVGSGNGACGFLSELQSILAASATSHSQQPMKILVLEEGQNFFYNEGGTHQRGWSKTYSTGAIYKVHNTVTPDNNLRSILSGRARIMGGAGSINYTMIHESSSWLAKNVGHDITYWNDSKLELNTKFHRSDPFEAGYQTPFAETIQANAIKDAEFLPANPKHMIANIPSLQGAWSEAENNDKQIYIFPTQFDRFGQRTNSGVSLVDWQGVTLRWNTRVTELLLEPTANDGNGDATKSKSTCTGVQVVCDDDSKNPITYKLKPKTGKLILCGGSQSPRLLMNTDVIYNKNDKIGTRVNDHICMCGPIYVIDKEQKKYVGPTDNYESLFTVFPVRKEPEKKNADDIYDDDAGDSSLVTLDFFSGDIQQLAFLLSSLFLSLVLPFNGFKLFMGRNPRVFTVLSNTIRIVLLNVFYIIVGLNYIIDTITFRPTRTIAQRLADIKVTTYLVKFSGHREGHYVKSVDDKIVLKFFDTKDSPDYDVAEKAFNEAFDIVQSNGHKPFCLVRWIIQLVTKLPYERGREVRRYVNHYAQKTLLSEQHLAGGCVWGDAVDKGLTCRTETGKVYGTTNIHVADLSTCPIPRVSTQMTAYLMGHHVAKQLYGTGEWKKEIKIK